MSNKNRENVYDVSSYTEKELLDILDLNDPSDRELEAKIIFMINKYNNIPGKSGEQFTKFFTDIYNHFFDSTNEDEENSDNENIDYEITEGFENANDSSNNQISQVKDTTMQELETIKQGYQNEKNKNQDDKSKQKIETQNIGFIKPLDFAPDQLNPLLNQTIKRIISIDSQYREDKTAMPTEFTFNLSTPLKDVVSLKLYSVHIPYSWYTISKSYGSNFIYLKGATPGILNNPSQDIMLDISAGNYNAQDLVNAMNSSVLSKQTYYSDVSFGNTYFSYNPNTTLASINIDITKQFNENSYYLSFENFTTPNLPDAQRNNSIPSFLGFNKQTYDLNTLNSNKVFPPYDPSLMTEIDNNPIYTIDKTNNYFTIIKYVSKYSLSTGIIENYSSDSIIDFQFNITLSGLITGGQYSRTDIYNEVVKQINNCSYLSNESYFKRKNITDNLDINYPYSYYQFKIKPNRYTTKNITNSKIVLQFPNDNIVWLGSNSCFCFNNLINEISNITAETKAIPQTINYDISGSPQILLTCSSENFISNLNNITINIESSPLNLPYTISQYSNAINNAIVKATTVTPFLNGPPSTNYKYIYNPYITPNYSYSYIDDNDIFNLLLRVNKTFNQDNYCIDLTNTYLYNILGLGDNLNGLEKLTQNDTIGIKGYIKNNNLFVTSGMMPQVNSQVVTPMISFDMSGITYGVPTTYGNLYLSKNDNYYIDGSANVNWTNINGRTYTVTETTYVFTSKEFSVIEPYGNLYVPSNVIDVSSNSFNVPGSYLTISGGIINIPSDISNIFFNNNSFKINGIDLSVNSKGWIVNGNSWSISNNNLWTVSGSIFDASISYWDISNSNFTLSSNNITSNNLLFSGNSLGINGSNFELFGNTMNFIYNKNDIFWNITTSDFSYSNPNYSVNTSNINANPSISNPLILKNSRITLFNNITSLSSDFQVTGNNYNINGSFNEYNFSIISNRLNINNNSYSVTGNSITYNSNYLTVNSSSINIPHNYFTITGTIPVATSATPLSINKPEYNLYGTSISISDASFNIGGNNVSLQSKDLILFFNNQTNQVNVIKNDIVSSGNGMNINSVSPMNILGNNWDVSCNSIDLFNPPTTRHYSLTSFLVFNGNNMIIPNNNTQIIYNVNNPCINVTGQINSNNLKLVSGTNGMNINIPDSIITTNDLSYITITGKDLSNNINTNFVIDTSYIKLSSNTNKLDYISNLFTYTSSNRFTFNYSGIWSLSGQYFYLENPGNTISIQYSDGNTASGIRIPIGSGLLSYNNINNEFTLNNSTRFSLTNGSTISFISGYNMIFNTSNNYDIMIGSFIINGNLLSIDNQLNNSKIYLTNNGFTVVGNTLITPTKNYFTVNSPNKDLSYNLTAGNININGNNLSITNNISAITGFLTTEPNNTINVTSSSNMSVSYIKNIFGNRSSILGNIDTSSNSITISADNSSYLYYILNPSISRITVTGTLLDLTNNQLSINGNINISNNSNYNTKFISSDYSISDILITSTSFTVNNLDTQNFNIFGTTFKTTYNKDSGVYFENYGNNITVYPNNYWKINSKTIKVYDNSFNFSESQFTLHSRYFIIPGNVLNIVGNTLDVSGGTFKTSNDNIYLNTSNNIVNSTYNSSTVIRNIYTETYPIYKDNISYIRNSDGSTTWIGNDSNGFTVTEGISLKNTDTITTTGNKISITCDGNNNYLISSTPTKNYNFLSISADILSVNNTGLINFLGKKYNLKTTALNLGTAALPYDFSINILYNKGYLPLQNIFSNSLLYGSDYYTIPKDEVVLRINPRFPSSIPVFGNENDIGYVITNNTGYDISVNTITDLQNQLILLFQNYKDSNGQNILSGSTVNLNLNATNNKVIVNSNINLVLTKSLKNKDYAIEFVNFANKIRTVETWKSNLFIDPSMVDVSYSLINTNPNIVSNYLKNQTIVSGQRAIETINIELIENVNNKLSFIAYENGTITNDVTIKVPVYDLSGRQILYSRDGLIKTINEMLSKTIASGTGFSVITDSNNISTVILRSNINLIYRPKDYHLVFYDTISFAKCYVGASSVRNTTWDTTVGWILGFRDYSEYVLSSFLTTNGMSYIVGDTGVCTNLFNYFLLCIDDFTQNHLNDGLITITGTDKNIPLPSYANRTNFSCDPVSGQLTYNNTDLVDNSKLTQNQIYSITQIVNNQNSNSSNLTLGINSKNFGLGPFVQDVFGLIPMKTTGLQPGSTYIEFGGTLQNQERTYFGPVNIHRMSIKLVTDRGDTVDLNNVNWSFSLICEQLYKQRPSAS